MIPTPTSVALRARRPLGAYSIPPETGLLIPSEKRDYRNVGFWRTRNKSHLPRSWVISTGRRTTRTKSQVQGSHRRRTSATPNAKKKASCLGKNEVQPQGFHGCI